MAPAPEIAPPTRRRLRAALATGVTGLSLVLVACGGGGSSTGVQGGPATEVPTDVVVATDPTAPISVEVGHRFSVVLPADPGEGWRWVVQPFDTSRLVALGSEFSDDEARRAASTVATSTTSTTQAGRGTTTTTAPPEPTTPTTAMPPLVQVVSFAGRAPGTAVVAFRAERIVATTPASPVVVQWTVQITPRPGVR